MLYETDLIDDGIPKIIIEDINHLLTIRPSVEEIHKDVFTLNLNSAHGPDVFGGFFQKYYDIVKDDVISIVSTLTQLCSFPRRTILILCINSDLLPWKILSSKSFQKFLLTGLDSSCQTSYLRSKGALFMEGS